MDNKEFIKWFKSTLYGAIAKELVAANEFVEAEHPRDKIGRFTDKGSGQKTVKKENSNWFPTSSYINNQITNIAGVKKGKPMSHKQAMNVNPNYWGEDKRYWENCQSCVVAYELCRRGYNVQAVPREYFGKIEELAENTFSAWIYPDSKKPCKSTIINAKTPEECMDWLDKNIKPGQRYVFVYGTEQEYDDDIKHIINIDRDKKGNLRMYDPQSNRERIGEDVYSRLEAIVDFSGKYPIEILRVDDKEVNPYFLDEVVQGNHDA